MGQWFNNNYISCQTLLKQEKICLRKHFFQTSVSGEYTWVDSVGIDNELNILGTSYV